MQKKAIRVRDLKATAYAVNGNGEFHTASKGRVLGALLMYDDIDFTEFYSQETGTTLAVTLKNHPLGGLDEIVIVGNTTELTLKAQ